MDFVPNHLGFRNLSREFLLQNTTVSSRLLHCENNPNTIITIWDGTYIYIDKSANYEFQKSTFSGQKNRNFLRPMVCVTTNGLIIDVFGPFEAIRNDAKCMKAILENDPSVSQLFQPGDVFIFDRGFRDCLEEIAAMDCVAKTPEFIKKNQPTDQLTTEQANRSRLVTKTRFVVELRNGNIKTIFSVFAQQWSTVCLRHLGDDLRIAAALINKYFQKVVADKGNEECVSNAMLSCLTSPNHLQQIVRQDMFQTHLAFFETVQENFRFPQIRKEELQSITMGPYQLRQAKSYASAHKKARMANEDGIEYLCYFCPDDICQYFFDKVIRDKNISEPVLVFTRMASRFKSRKSYDSYILADAAKNGPGAIIS